MHGPLRFCDLDREGMLVEVDKEACSTYYNDPYYIDLEACYVKDADWIGTYTVKWLG